MAVHVELTQREWLEEECALFFVERKKEIFHSFPLLSSSSCCLHPRTTMITVRAMCKKSVGCRFNLKMKNEYQIHKVAFIRVYVLARARWDTKFNSNFSNFSTSRRYDMVQEFDVTNEGEKRVKKFAKNSHLISCFLHTWWISHERKFPSSDVVVCSAWIREKVAPSIPKFFVAGTDLKSIRHWKIV